MTADQFTRATVAMEVWRRAPTRDLQTLLAIAYITRNRVRAGWMGGQWLSVLANEPAYSAYQSAGVVVGQVEFPDLRDPVMQKFLWEIERVVDGTSEDKITRGGLWWAELNKITRDWFLEKIARQPEQHPRVATIGAITLFA